MPGVASLQAGEYYAHPRNAFWRIMGDLFAAGLDLPYAQRVERLSRQHVAVWDVLAHCERPGSLDADIVVDSAQANDFAALLAGLPELRWVFFNGAAAERYFLKVVAPTLAAPHLQFAKLPSTSPAHAGLSYTGKLAAWESVKRATQNAR